MLLFIKRVVSRLPERWQNEMKRIYFARQIKKSKFITDEPEYAILDKLIKAGDWVIDVGANVGHYTKRFSDLVGSSGRVIAFEPVPETFALLAANAELFVHKNVTLINAAVSDHMDTVGISIPKFATGLTNYYEACVSAKEAGSLTVLSVSVDDFHIEQKVALIKIDAEGHELFVLAGMQRLVEKDRPCLIVENPSDEIQGNLSKLGYASKRLPGSPNMLFQYNTV